MFFVVCFLHRAASFRFRNGALHGAGHVVRVHDNRAVLITGGAADCLYHRRFAAEEAFLVGVQNGHQGYFRHVETFAEQVDSDEHVEHAGAQIANNVGTLDSGDIRV